MNARNSFGCGEGAIRGHSYGNRGIAAYAATPRCIICAVRMMRRVKMRSSNGMTGGWSERVKIMRQPCAGKARNGRITWLVNWR